jgi:presenilin-like A22 family membrane protease
MSHRHRRPSLPIDWVTAVFVGLILLFQGGVLLLLNLDLPRPPSQTTDVTVSGRLILLAAVEITAILLVWRGWKRLPARWRQRIARTLKLLLWGVLYFGMLTVTYLLDPLAALLWIGIVPVGYYGLQLLDGSPYSWLVFNGLVIVLGVFVSRILALTAAPIVLIPIMIAAILYDYFAVELSDVMGDLVDLSMSLSLPNFIVIPTTWRFDLDGAIESLQDGEKPDNMAFMIGLGDFLFPSVFLGSVWVAESGVSPMLVGAGVGTLVAAVHLRLVLERRESGLPALPWLNTGALAGYGLGLVITLLPTLA